MELGVFSVCMPGYGLDETVSMLKAIGYDAVEWRVAEIPERIPEEIPFDRRYWVWNESTVDIKRIGELAPRLRRMCDDAGLSITGFDTYLTSDRIPEIVPVLEAAKAAGVRMVRLFADRYSYDSEKPYDEIFRNTREGFVPVTEPVAELEETLLAMRRERKRRHAPCGWIRSRARGSDRGSRQYGL